MADTTQRSADGRTTETTGESITDHHHTDVRVSRRREFLAAASVAGLAGCLDDVEVSVSIGGDDEGDDAASDSDDEEPASGEEDGAESDEADDEETNGADEDEEDEDEEDEPGRLSFEEDRLALDPEAIEIHEGEDTWSIVDGRSRLLVFDEREDAERAHDVIRAYGFTERGFVERPDPGLTYWLIDGEPPSSDDASFDEVEEPTIVEDDEEDDDSRRDRPQRPDRDRRDDEDGDENGEDCIQFEPDTLHVTAADSGYRIDGRTDGSGSRLFLFETEDAAENALEVIRYYGFERTCSVGQSEASMMYLLADS